MKTPRKRRHGRKLKLQALEARQLLAADFGELQNRSLPEDVNADGDVTAVDALAVINAMQETRSHAADGGQPMFRDVNGDGQLTSVDALRVINRMGRDRNGDGGRQDDGPPPPPPPPLAAEPEFRSIDGTGNNVDDPLLGSAGTELRRLVDSDYADGISEPSGEDRASAREISNIVAAQDESILSSRNLSDLVWQWGQFIDHDITLSEGGEDEAFNIEVPAGDPYFDPTGTGEAEIAFTRSAIAEGTGEDTPRQHVNGITAFIDGSMIYGSDDDTAASLRSLAGGRLLTSEGDLLPIDETGFFQAGDVRANEQNGLTAMHTLWVREHNRVADQIAEDNPDLDDEAIYQRARAFVIGEIQAITYNEYLPVLLGRDAISPYEGYDETVDPSISNLFATAAFRYGHTSLSSELLRLDDEGNVIEEGSIALRDAFFNPSGILEVGIDPYLKGLSSNVSQEIDNQLVDDVRNFLFGPPGAGGFDLAALNIQRGRDHGLPDYNSAREQLGLERAETFADISSDPEVQANLEEAYGDVDSIDVWVGALAEDHVRGGSVGELVQTVLAEQFTALRDGDRFWYQNEFRGEQLRQLQQTRLSDVIERNTELTSIQDNAFVVPSDEVDRLNGPGPRGPRNDGPPPPPPPRGDDGPPPPPPRNDGPPPPPRNDEPSTNEDGDRPPRGEQVVDNPDNNEDQDTVDRVDDRLPPPPPPRPNQSGAPPENGEQPPRPRPPRDAGDDAQRSGLDTNVVDQAFGELGA